MRLAEEYYVASHFPPLPLLVPCSFYVPRQSSPLTGQYMFSYTVRISNEGASTVQLRYRFWLITDGDNGTQEARCVHV